MSSSSESPVVNLQRTLESFEELWSPRILAQINNYDVRVVKVQGEFVWHRHPDTEEFFLVLDGELEIGLRDDDDAESSVRLGRGDVYVVPRNHLHRPVSPAEWLATLHLALGLEPTSADDADPIRELF